MYRLVTKKLKRVTNKKSETTTRPGAQTIYFVELLPTKIVDETGPAITRMVNRIENLHRCKAVYRVHADRAQELTGSRIRQALEGRGIAVTSTAGYDSNANGRAERAVLFFQEKLERCYLRGYDQKSFRSS